MGIILGVETSTHIGSIALRIDGQLKENKELSQEGRRHAQTLVSEIHNLFKTHNVSPKDCDKIAISIGPGSFTGLRVGVVLAKMMAYSSKCKLIPIDTMLAIAENSPDNIEEISVVTNAQRGDLFLGNYIRDRDGRFQRTGDITIVSGKEWCSHLTESSRVTGNGIKIISDFIPNNKTVLPEKYWLPNAEKISYLGEISNTFLNENEVIALEPFYLRKSAAEEKRLNEMTSK